MSMGKLTRRQIEEFRRRVGSVLNFFFRCKRRLESLGFKDSDKVFKGVTDVHRALHALHFELWESGSYSTKKRDEELPPPSDRDF
jgi:hypothetical protein